MSDSDHHDHSELADIELRVRTLESILTEKGYIDPAAVDALVEAYETRVGPRNGAQVVAKAWTDEGFAQWLPEDANAAIASCGFGGLSGCRMVAVESTPTEHNVVMCTLCSRYPWPVLGLPPVWYKSAPYRSRTVMDHSQRVRRRAAQALGGARQTPTRMKCAAPQALSMTLNRRRQHGRGTRSLIHLMQYDGFHLT
jgi:hypothetical protein